MVVQILEHLKLVFDCVNMVSFRHLYLLNFCLILLFKIDDNSYVCGTIILGRSIKGAIAGAIIAKLLFR